MNKDALIAVKDDFLAELKSYQEKVERLPKNDWYHDGYDDSAYYANPVNTKELKDQEILILRKYAMFADFFDYLGIWEEVIKDCVSSTTGSLSKYDNIESSLRELYMATDMKIEKYIKDKRSDSIKDNLQKIDTIADKTLSYAERIKKLFSPLGV